MGSESHLPVVGLCPRNVTPSQLHSAWSQTCWLLPDEGSCDRRGHNCLVWPSWPLCCGGPMAFWPAPCSRLRAPLRSHRRWLTLTRVSVNKSTNHDSREQSKLTTLFKVLSPLRQSHQRPYALLVPRHFLHTTMIGQRPLDPASRSLHLRSWHRRTPLVSCTSKDVE
jgi:hypothetical protein